MSPSTPPEGSSKGRLTRWLASAPPWLLTGYALAAAFATYFCMYAFRKPFTAATFEGQKFLGSGLDLKTAFVIGQIVGYTLSKYLGIKFCSEVGNDRRAALLVGLILAAETALLLFAVLPPALQVVALFCNGVPLGMVWGLVVRYLEGRRTSELLLAGLSCSFIVSSGIVKDVGRWLMASPGVAETWMPFLAGLLFLPAFLGSVWLLNQVPPPNAADVTARVRRQPMNHLERRAFVRQFLPGLLLLLIAYFFITAYRDFRDNYGVEIIDHLGFLGDVAIFTRIELVVAFGVLAALAALNLIRDNRLGLVGAYAIMAGGLVLLGGGTLLLDLGWLDGFWWMILMGLGSYLAFVPYGSVLFDRLIASTRVPGNAVFAIYLADAIGYTGSVGVQLYKDLAQTQLSRFGFFRNFSYVLATAGTLLLAASCVWFLRRHCPKPTT
jgi:hypothetical protein